MAAQNDLEFQQILDRAALNLPDGIGVVWAAWRKRFSRFVNESPDRRIYRLAERAADTGWKIFLLGAADGVAEQLRDQITPSCCIRIVDVAGLAATRRRCRRRSSHSSIRRGYRVGGVRCAQAGQVDRSNLARTGAKVGIGIGGSLDFVVGTQRRAPHWIQRLNSEWLYRLGCELWRWRRQLALPKFVWRAFS
ncbi:MAG: WecB/TagA/CpsF family glycosyltransferase [Anaerolineae bacterium]